MDTFGEVAAIDVAGRLESDVCANRFVVISGCSGGGKSTLLAELGRRGHTIIEEPGRRLVAEEMNNGGSALPWVDMPAFAHRTITMALADRSLAPASDGWIFFDRSLIDAAVALQHLTREPVLEQFGQTHPYHHRVFLAPPWPELYMIDRERRPKPAAADEVSLLYPGVVPISSSAPVCFITGKFCNVSPEKADFVGRNCAESSFGAVLSPRNRPLKISTSY